MTGSNREGDPKTVEDTRKAEVLKQFGINFDKSVRKGVEQLRSSASQTQGRISIPELGFGLRYQFQDKHDPIESLTITHGNNLPGLTLETRFFTMYHLMEYLELPELKH